MTDESESRYATAEQVNGYCKRWSGNRCWNCVFFDLSEEMTAEEVMVNGEVIGTRFIVDGKCRCHSPTHGVTDDGGDTAKWPWVQGHDWCGEHEGKGLAEAIEQLKRFP